MRVYNRCRHIMWQTVFVFGDSSVERVDTPELVQPTERDRAAVVQERPMELDRAQAKKERNQAKKKAWEKANVDHLKEYQKRYQKKYYADPANIDRRRANNKQWRADAANIEKQKAYSHIASMKQYAANPEKCKADARACKLRNYGCIECKDWPDCRVGLPHYDSHCYRCFSRKFPDHPKVRVKERAEDRTP